MFHEIQDAFSSPVQAIAHLSYLLLVVSMMMRDMTRLRVLAVTAGVVEIFYRVNFLYDPVSIFWKSLFILVNLVQLAILWYEHMRASFSEDEEHFIKTIVPGLRRARAHKLVRAGTWKNAMPGERLTTDGVVVPDLMFISGGAVRIEKAGQIVAVCADGDFIGEMSFITGEPASADAIADRPVRYLSFERAALGRLLDAEPELRAALEASFNRNLIDKLVKSNDDRVGREGPPPMPA